jgi:hypothetical protein
VLKRILTAAACMLAILTVAACNDTNAVGTPTQPTQNSLTGRWTGDLSVQGVTGRMTWTLTQTGTSVTGPITVGLPTGTVLLNGTLTGTLNGTSLPYTIAVGPSGVPTQPSCTGQLGGTMTVNDSAVPTMTGNIAVTNTNCNLQVSTNVTLTKQSGIGS